MPKQKPKPVLMAAGGDSLVEMFATETPSKHPLEGMFCHQWEKDPVWTQYGKKWSRQARVESVIGDHALIQLYGAAWGEPSDIVPIPLSDLLSGDWTFYRSAEEWRDAGDESAERWWRNARADPRYGEHRSAWPPPILRAGEQPTDGADA